MQLNQIASSVMETTYRNTALLFTVILVFVIVAFFKTYFGLFPDFKDTNLAVHIHVAMVLLWFAMLIAQPILIGAKRLQLHRLVGKVSYILVPLVVFTGALMIRQAQMREKNLIIFTANIIDLSIFVLLFAFAIIYKRKMAWHSRLMILTVLPFISPAAGRLQINGLAIELSILLILLIIERFNSKIYKPYLLGLSIFLIIYLASVALFILKPDVLDSLWKVFFSQA